MGIEIVEYDPSWPSQAAAAQREILTVLPGVFQMIEHIGSTAVPGLAAKPVIDLMAATAELGLVTARESALVALGYQRRESGMPERLFYTRDRHGRRINHVHVVREDSWHTRNERLLRDYLREHPEDANRYARLKRRLAAGGHTADEYTRGKTDLIQELTDRARESRGLPTVPVWEA